MRNLFEDFYAVVVGERKERTVTTFDEATQVTRVVDAVLRSDRERRWVEVPG